MNFGGLLKRPLAWIFCQIGRLRNLLFDLELLRAEKLSVPVVSVGNSTMGGSGKTPFILWLIEKLKAEQISLGVISRGYRGSYSGVVEVDRFDLPEVHGDEPSMLKKKHFDVPIFVGRNRVKAGLHLLKQYSVSLVLADDALQHRWLARDLNILLFDVSRPFINFEIFPLGFGRESLASSLARADIVCVTKTNLAVEENWREQLSLIKSSAKSGLIWCFAEYKLHQLCDLNGDVISLDQLKGYKVFSAIAHPDGLVRSATDFLGFGPNKVISFADHAEISLNDANNILNSLTSDEFLVITEKDEVKWPVADERVLVAHAKLKITEGENEILDSLRRLAR